MINPNYNDLHTLRNIHNVFAQQGIIHLLGFFTPKAYTTLKNHLEKTKHAPDSIPLLHSYATAPFTADAFLTALQPVLSAIVQQPLVLAHANSYRFTRRDYTLLHDTHNEDDGITVIFDFTNNWKKSYGSYHAYIQGEKEIARIHSYKNTTTIITTNSRMQHYIKYINHTARSRTRTFLTLCYHYA